MATDELPEGLPQQEHAVVFALYPGDTNFFTVVERDADSSGAPEGNEEIVAWLEPGVRHYVEYRPATDSFFHYRFRHGGFGFDLGEPTAWYRAKAVEFSGEIPNIPREARFDLDLALDGANGNVDIFINAGGVKAQGLPQSAKWASSTSAYPAAETGTTVALDLDGDATVDDAFTLTVGQTGYVTVTFYAGSDATGAVLSVLRASTTYSASGLTVPTIQEVISESANQGTLTLTVNDPDELVTQVRFRTKVGKAPFSDWTAESVPAPSYGPWSVNLDAKHLSFIEYEVTYTLAGETDVIQSAIAYDSDNIPELTQLTFYIGIGIAASVPGGGFESVSRNGRFDYIGDTDVASIRYAHSTSDYPDRTTTQSGAVNAGRTGIEVGENIPQVSVNLPIYLSVLAYSEADGTGTESEVLYNALIPADPGSGSGTIILNPFFDSEDPNEGSHWATEAGSDAVANASSPAGEGVSFTAAGDDALVTLIQVTDDDDDITKEITV